MGTIVNRRRYMGGKIEEPGYLTFVAEEAGTFSFFAVNNVGDGDVTSMSYSIDGGKTWTTGTSTGGSRISLTTPTIPAGGKVMWKGIANRFSTGSNGAYRFGSQKAYRIYGHLASLFIGDNYVLNEFPSTVGTFACCRLIPYSKVTSIEGMIFPEAASDNCYTQMFSPSSSLVSAKDVEIRTKGNVQYSLNGMFQDCSNLLTPPVLPSTELNRCAYLNLFKGCTSLVTPPALPATVFNNGYVYNNMFYGCTSLATAPALPATTLTRSCYSSMFNGCTSLVESPVLSAASTVQEAYQNMFNGCTQLTRITMLATRIYNGSLNGWVTDVAANGTFVKNANMTTLPSGVNGIPDGWTVIDN